MGGWAAHPVCRALLLHEDERAREGRLAAQRLDQHLHLAALVIHREQQLLRARG